MGARRQTPEEKAAVLADPDHRAEAARFAAAQVDHRAGQIERGEIEDWDTVNRCTHHYARVLGISAEEITAARKEQP